MRRTIVINTVLMSQNQFLVCVLKEILQNEGIVLKYVHMPNVEPRDLFLIVRGFTPVISMKYLLDSRYRKQAIVLMKPSPHWPVSRDAKKMEEIENALRVLGYKYAAVGANDKELACYAHRAIKESFV